MLAVLARRRGVLMRERARSDLDSSGRRPLRKRCIDLRHGDVRRRELCARLEREPVRLIGQTRIVVKLLVRHLATHLSCEAVGREPIAMRATPGLPGHACTSTQKRRTANRDCRSRRTTRRQRRCRSEQVALAVHQSPVPASRARRLHRAAVERAEVVGPRVPARPVAEPLLGPAFPPATHRSCPW